MEQEDKPKFLHVGPLMIRRDYFMGYHKYSEHHIEVFIGGAQTEVHTVDVTGVNNCERFKENVAFYEDDEVL